MEDVPRTIIHISFIKLYIYIYIYIYNMLIYNKYIIYS